MCFLLMWKAFLRGCACWMLHRSETFTCVYNGPHPYEIGEVRVNSLELVICILIVTDHRKFRMLGTRIFPAARLPWNCFMSDRSPVVFAMHSFLRWSQRVSKSVSSLPFKLCLSAMQHFWYLQVIVLQRQEVLLDDKMMMNELCCHIDFENRAKHFAYRT